MLSYEHQMILVAIRPSFSFINVAKVMIIYRIIKSIPNKNNKKELWNFQIGPRASCACLVP
jgi:hypothetical protein